MCSGIENLTDLAEQSGIPLERLRGQYELFVLFMRFSTRMLQDQVEGGELSEGAERVARAVLGFFNVYDSYGYYDLE